MSQQRKTKTPQITPSPTEKKDEDLFADVNITMKSGRLTKDAEVLSSGKYVRIRLATNKEYLDGNGEVQKSTNYFNALVSSNLKDSFEIAKSLKKGDWAYIKGEDQSRSFDTPEGYKQTAVTTFAWKVVKKKENGQSTNAPEIFDQAQEPSHVPS